MRLSAVCFYLVLVSSCVCCRSLHSQPNFCFSNSAGWSCWWSVSFRSISLLFKIKKKVIDWWSYWKWTENISNCHNSLSSSSSSVLGAAWCSADSGCISWWRSHSSRRIPSSPWHPSAVCPTSPRCRSHSCCTGNTAHTQKQKFLYVCKGTDCF